MIHTNAITCSKHLALLPTTMKFYAAQSSSYCELIVDFASSVGHSAVSELSFMVIFTLNKKVIFTFLGMFYFLFFPSYPYFLELNMLTHRLLLHFQGHIW